jgi:hypothetical protein
MMLAVKLMDICYLLQHILTEVAGGLRLLVGLRVVTVVVDDSVAQDIECLL